MAPVVFRDCRRPCLSPVVISTVREASEETRVVHPAWTKAKHSMSPIPAEMRAPLFLASGEALRRIKDVSVKVNSPESREACRAQVKQIDAQPSWSVLMPVYRAFYDLMSCADPAQVPILLQKMAGAVMASSAAMAGKDEIGPVWEIFGLAKGDPALELAKFKETASSLMQIAQESLETSEKKLKETRAELESALRANKEMESLVELTQTRASDCVNKASERVSELEKQDADQQHKLQEQAAAINKLRAELQTAQAKAAETVNRPVAEVPGDVQAELTRLKTLTAEQAGKIADRDAKIKQYRDAADGCFDRDLKRRFIFVAENRHKVGQPGSDPDLDMHVKDAEDYIWRSLDGHVKT